MQLRQLTILAVPHSQSFLPATPQSYVKSKRLHVPELPSQAYFKLYHGATN